MEETDPRYSRRLRSRLSAENVLSSSSTLQVRWIAFFSRENEEKFYPSRDNRERERIDFHFHRLCPLQSIKEEERKKNKINDAANNPNSQDELTIYLRQPYGDPQLVGSRRFSSKLKKGADEEKMIDKIEIDSDNIETPPATRKLFSPPREVKPVEREPCKRERCNGSFQRDFKNTTGKSVNNNADFGTGKTNIRCLFYTSYPKSKSWSMYLCRSLSFQVISIVIRRRGEREGTRRIKRTARRKSRSTRWSIPIRSGRNRPNVRTRFRCRRKRGEGNVAKRRLFGKRNRNGKKRRICSI